MLQAINRRQNNPLIRLRGLGIPEDYAPHNSCLAHEVIWIIPWSALPKKDQREQEEGRMRKLLAAGRTADGEHRVQEVQNSLNVALLEKFHRRVL